MQPSAQYVRNATFNAIHCIVQNRHNTDPMHSYQQQSDRKSEGGGGFLIGTTEKNSKKSHRRVKCSFVPELLSARSLFFSGLL